MVKMIDNFMHSSSLGRIISANIRRKNAMGTFEIDDELTNIESQKAASEITETSEIQSSAFVQRMALLKIQNAPNTAEIETIFYGDGLLDQLNKLHCQLLGGEVSLHELTELETSLGQLPQHIGSIPSNLKDIIADIQVRVAVELAKLSINR